MPWFYKDGDLEIGPVEKMDLQQLVKTGKINGRTLIRNADAKEWKPLSEMVRPKKPQTVEKQPVTEPEAEPEPPLTMERDDAPAPVPPPQPTAVCSQCGRSLPRDQVLEYEGKAICGACKPMFIQRMREGVGIARAMNYAGFWIRFVAKLIDGIVLFIVQWLIIIPISLMAGGAMAPAAGELPSSGFFMLMGMQQLIGIVIPACYTTFFIGKFRATPGKMACRLQVVMPDGERVSYMRALGRNFAEWISALILLIGYIMAGFDSEKRALHDRICSTRVVKK
ncbi:MAG: RDD family protein [Desulfosarcinaceae bacterium]